MVEQYPEIAREYSKVIHRPIDLRTIKQKIPTYHTFKEFDEDISLMYRNAENFNKQDSYIIPVSHVLHLFSSNLGHPKHVK